jgi:Pyridoxamine 5''-phosphate oxidase.
MTTEEYKKAADFWKAKESKEMPVEQLKPIVEEFLRSSAVCALATGTGDYVRCTPLEYSYHDGKFWIFTEGGEKFIGLEKNKNVSLAVFEKNPDFGELKSVQVMGTAKLIESMSAEYVAHAEYKKIPVAVLQKLADQGHPMYLLCITPVRMDVLFSDFKKQGYDSRQKLDFTQK